MSTFILMLACPLLAFMVLLGGLILLIATLVKKSGGGARPHALREGLANLVQPRHYFARQYLMSRGEAAFYRVLQQAVGSDFIIMSKVRLSDLIDTRATGKQWARKFNSICRKHADFVLLSAHDLRIRLVIELDDATHSRTGRPDRDANKDAILQEAGLTLLRIPATTNYHPHEIRQRIQHALPTSLVAN